MSRTATTLWSRLTTGIFGRGAVSFLLATAGVNASNFFFHIVVSRLLGPAHYGAVGAILSILSLMAVPVGAAQLAVTQAVIGHINNGQSFSLSRLIWRAFMVGFFAMLAFAALTPTIDGFLYISSPLPLYLVAAWIPFATVGAVLQGALIGEYRFRAVAFAVFAGGGPVRLLFGAGLVLAGAGVTGAIIATIFAQAFSTISLLFSARQKLRGDSQRSVVRSTRRDMTLSIASIGSYTALIGVDTFLARHFFVATVAGQYAAGAIAAHIALFVPSAIVAVAFPHWVSGEGTGLSSRKAFVQALKFTVLLGILSACALTVLSGLVVHVLFGSSYTRAVPIVGLLAFASAVIGMISLFIYFHLARRSLVALTPWLGVALAIILITLRHQSMTSVAMIMLIVSLLTLLATGIPAIVALASAAARDAAGDVSLMELPPIELDFTLVVPIHNPESRFHELIAETTDKLSSAEFSYEILVVSETSTELSETQLETDSSDRLTLLPLEEDRGKGAALRAAITKSRGEYLGFIDSEGDLPINVISNLLEIIHREHPDMIFESMRHSPSEFVDQPLRRTYSWGYQQLNRVLFQLPVRDTQSGVNVIRRDVLQAVLPHMMQNGSAFDLELFVVARHQGFRKIVELPIVIGERFSSSVSLRSIRNTFHDTLTIFYRLRVLRSYDRPLGLQVLVDEVVVPPKEPE